MAELFDMKELEERVILVAVSTSDEDDTEASLDELEELADTAGATAIGRLVQGREQHLAIAFIYLSDELTATAELEEKMKIALSRISEKLSS